MGGSIKITKLDGSITEVAAVIVWRITLGMPDETGVVHTQVDYGSVLQLTNEPVASLVAELATAGVRMINLTAPDQSTLYLNSAQIMSIQLSLDGVDAPSSHSALIVAGHRQAVAETPAEVEARL